MNVVADASVAIKWALPFRSDEPDSEQALGLLSRVRDGMVRLHQPPHWFAEVSGVLVRLSPETALDDIADLHEIRFERVESKALYLRASKLAMDLGQHLFDALYHAVALEVPDGVLVTADERYYRKARALGHIARLADLPD